MRLIDADALIRAIQDQFDNLDVYFPSAFIKEVEETPSVNPCNNCDLYFKAMTKEEKKGGKAWKL